ncbi:hypothetical protein AB0958_21885 [Streptomyces sp. NPDC006655]|uniref:hypothetical protein n=1 Tax=Streptomyces sp. NPDC006655 TaxID=3156898 RepID=UPI003455F75A
MSSETRTAKCARCKRDVPVVRTRDKDGARVCSPDHGANYSECMTLWMALHAAYRPEGES